MDHDHDRGLAFDLSTLLERRRALRLMAGAGLVTLIGCGSDAAKSAVGSSTTASTAAAGAGCDPVPEETAGPYPGDGSNGPNILTESGIVRSDIRSSFGSSSGTAGGVPLTIKLAVLDSADGCAPLGGAAVYIWHCDRGGLYSMYSQGATDQNYLRGVQETDSGGGVTFTSIFPAAYSGRWPHIHFEVYPSLAEATSAGTVKATSQLALPSDVCQAVYATDGYSQSVQNLARTSLATDMVFRDGSSQQLATMTGNVSAGLVATLSVPV
jgi:protocatechuate 3,4-dioxygenase beta subunit